MSVEKIKAFIELRIQALTSEKGMRLVRNQPMIREAQLILGEVNKHVHKTPEQIQKEEQAAVSAERAKAEAKERKDKKIAEIRARKAEREAAELANEKVK